MIINNEFDGVSSDICPPITGKITECIDDSSSVFDGEMTGP